MPISHGNLSIAALLVMQIVYADVPSVAKPVFIHEPKAKNSLGVLENKRLNSEGDEPEAKRWKKNPILFDQAELNDLIRILNLSKDKLNCWNLD